MADWKGAVKDFLDVRIGGYSTPHLFKFYMDGDNPAMVYKEHCNDSEWMPEGGAIYWFKRDRYGRWAGPSFPLEQFALKLNLDNGDFVKRRQGVSALVEEWKDERPEFEKHEEWKRQLEISRLDYWDKQSDMFNKLEQEKTSQPAPLSTPFWPTRMTGSVEEVKIHRDDSKDFWYLYSLEQEVDVEPDAEDSIEDPITSMEMIDVWKTLCVKQQWLEWDRKHAKQCAWFYIGKLHLSFPIFVDFYGRIRVLNRNTTIVTLFTAAKVNDKKINAFFLAREEFHNITLTSQEAFNDPTLDGSLGRFKTRISHDHALRKELDMRIECLVHSHVHYLFGTYEEISWTVEHRDDTLDVLFNRKKYARGGKKAVTFSTGWSRDVYDCPYCGDGHIRWSGARMAGRWGGRVVGCEDWRMGGWQNGGMARWEDGQAAGWQDGRVAGWKDGRTVRSSSEARPSYGGVSRWSGARMAGRWGGRVVGCEDRRMGGLQNDGMARWEDGRAAGWQNGRVAGWKDGRTVGSSGEARPSYGGVSR
ncbi:hypothetical protein CBR_g23601 [Chara braunii]|uniref:Uncharacterized protein n=1 Tax=Chara braunii TaxID=69332 RepID=A0A388L4V1_CHABU|nr:hypothetical protein CBR_g23601 [Chara braunii]|eukprot:GBG77272.1 hypothetical protein CBR_g23601 [Chara braunii]